MPPVNTVFCVILSLPRSYSSIICAALGSHPQLHALPELNLFVCDSVDELLQMDARATADTGIPLTHISGLIRSLAHLQFGDKKWPRQRAFCEAERWLREHAHWSTRRLLHHVQDLVRPNVGVDKSPRTTLQHGGISRSLDWLPEGRYVHLLRHPIAFAASLAGAHSRALGAVDPRLSSAFGPAVFGLHLWLHIHQRILDATCRLPPSRLRTIRAEDVLRNPREQFGGLAAWLGIRTDQEATDDMLHPERSPYANLELAPPGGDNDINFLQRPCLRHIESLPPFEMPSAWNIDPRLFDEIARLCKSVGYEIRMS